MSNILHPKIQSLKDNNKIIFETYRGSYVYGTYIEGKSDKDISGIYMSTIDEILGFDYKNQVSDDTNDATFYDVKRFLELAQTSNPTMLELLFTPKKFHIYCHPIMDKIFEHKYKFITKACKKSFSAYAIQQIKKAKGLDKKMNYEQEKVVRKTVLDYCYVPENYQSIKVTEWLKKRSMLQEYCGLVKLPHMKDVYALFYNFVGHKENSKNAKELTKKWIKFDELIKSEFSCSTGLKYKGIVQKDEKSNDVSLSEVPTNELAVCFMNFNKDAYSVNCKKFKEYEDWQEVVNRERLVDVQNHGQKIDGKNMLHCVRLIKTAKEIAQGQGIIIERPDAQELLKIRRGEVDLQSIIDWGEKEIETIDYLFDNSGLPDEVDPNFVNELLLDIRKEYYGINKKTWAEKIFSNNLLNSFIKIH